MDSFQEGLTRLGYQFVPFLIAVVGHEFGHGLAAYFWGDRTAEEQGRLTLSPLPHIDLIGTLAFPIINMLSGMNLLFGWAKPVPIDPKRFRNFRAGLFCVALAGSFSNFLIATLSACGLCLLLKYSGPQFFFFEELKSMLLIAVYLNYGIGFFNLLPFPPLDGSKIVESVLPLRWVAKYERLGRFSVILLLIFMFTGAISYLNGPIVFLGNTTLAWVSQLFQIQLT